MKSLTTYLLVILTFVSIFAITACNGEKANSKEGLDGEDNPTTEAENEVASIVINKTQFEKAGMELGSPELAAFSQSVKTNGYIVATPNGMAKIGAPIEGKVTTIDVVLGQKVKKGQALFTLESNGIILLQQEYAESNAKLKLLKSNLERIKNLSAENITAKKELIRAETEYKAMFSTNEGLKARLRIIGVNAKDVEEGIIHSKAVISSPIDGHITELELLLGEYLQAGDAQIEVIDSKNLQLLLHVFEKDYALLEVGQAVHFQIPGKKFVSSEAVLTQLGKRINSESRTVKCVARIETKDSDDFLYGSFVESEIITCAREALALPRTALIDEDNRYYVFIKVEENDDQLFFRKVPVKTGVIQNELAEIMEEDLENVLLKGVFSLY